MPSNQLCFVVMRVCEIKYMRILLVSHNFLPFLFIFKYWTDT